mmetsp:Transcript_119115/g.273184  ORF Transcript_119115/g.273184 Transcript_119115/m.273184 type:complete len:333 (-) Transcript_119115:196-1194(-)
MPTVFGDPILLRLSERTTGKEAWEKVWSCVKQSVPGCETEKPFVLTRTTSEGSVCSQCAWYEACCGCVVPDNDLPIGGITEWDTIGIDWDREVLEKWYFPQVAGVVDEDKDSAAEVAAAEEAASQVTLETCLQTFTRAEDVVAYCPKCTKANGGEFQESPQTKRLMCWSFPPVLILQLKRFKDSHRKLDSLVRFPLRGLDLSQFQAETAKTWTSEHSASVKDTTYDCFAVVNHTGSLHGGHYFSYIAIDGSWYCFNDSQVAPIGEDCIVSSKAYLIFYVRRSTVDEKKIFSDFFPRVPGATAQSVDLIRASRYQRQQLSARRPDSQERCVAM